MHRYWRRAVGNIALHVRSAAGHGAGIEMKEMRELARLPIRGRVAHTAASTTMPLWGLDVQDPDFNFWLTRLVLVRLCPRRRHVSHRSAPSANRWK